LIHFYKRSRTVKMFLPFKLVKDEKLYQIHT